MTTVVATPLIEHRTVVVRGMRSSIETYVAVILKIVDASRCTDIQTAPINTGNNSRSRIIATTIKQHLVCTLHSFLLLFFIIAYREIVA